MTSKINQINNVINGTNYENIIDPYCAQSVILHKIR